MKVMFGEGRTEVDEADVNTNFIALQDQALRSNLCLRTPAGNIDDVSAAVAEYSAIVTYPKPSTITAFNASRLCRCNRSFLCSRIALSAPTDMYSFGAADSGFRWADCACGNSPRPFSYPIRDRSRQYKV